MTEQKNRKIWKIRTVKNYPETHNHLIIGQVLQLTQFYIQIDCKTYHFGKSVNNTKNIKQGGREIRLLPWSRVELINVLPESFDYVKAELRSDNDGTIKLDDNHYCCDIISSYDAKY